MFKKGDVVSLKSGGPKMTVSEIGGFYDGLLNKKEEDKDEVECTWFEGNKKKSDHFSIDILEKQ